MAEYDTLGGHSDGRFHQDVGRGKRLRHDISDEKLRIRHRKGISVTLNEQSLVCSQVWRQHQYLQGGLAVGHCGRALGGHNDRHVEAIVGKSRGGTRNTEGLGQGVPGFLAEN